MFDWALNTLLQNILFYTIFVKRSFLDVSQGYEYAATKFIKLQVQLF